MTFENPWGLAALLSLPAILLLHLLQHRFPRRPSSAIFLWGPPAPSSREGRSLRRPPAAASLLLQMAAAAAISAIVAQPRWGPAARRPHLVAVLDGSASMAATPPTAPSPRDRAAAWLERRIEEEPDSLVTLVATGPAPIILAGPAAPPEGALRALHAWTPSWTGHDPAPALRLARTLAARAGEGGTPRLLFLTDAADPAAPCAADVETHAMGQPLPNAGLLEAHRLPHPDGTSTARVTACGFSDTPLARTLRWIAEDGTELGRAELTLPPRSPVEARATFPPGTGWVRATLSPDAMTADDVADLPPPRARAVRIGSSLPAGPVADRLARAVRCAPDALWEEGVSPGVHLAVTPWDARGVLPEGAWQLLVPVSAGADAPPEAGDPPVDLAGPWLPLRAHPVLAGVTLDGIVWTGARREAPPGTPVLSAGAFVLLSEESFLGGYRLHLNLDLARTNLADSPDWPILVSNLVEMRRAALPGLARRTFRAGETARLRLPPEIVGNPLVLETPVGERPLAATDPLVLPALAVCGRYGIHDGGTALESFAVNFHDPSESDLTGRGTGHIAARAPAPPPPVEGARPVRRLDQALLLAALAALGIEAWLALRVTAGARADTTGEAA